MPSFRQTDDRVVLHACGAFWTIWTRHHADGDRFVGPGYIGRVDLPDKRRLVDDFSPVSTGWSLNEPRQGGLGCFGLHLARRNDSFPDTPTSCTWDFTGRMAVGTYGVQRVDLIDGPRETAQGVVLLVRVWLSDGESYPNPLLSVTYDYLATDHDVRCHVDVESQWDGNGSPVFVKEPKVVAGALNSYQHVDLLGPKGLLKSVDLGAIADPGKRTLQFREAGRNALRFSAAGLPALTIRCDRGLERWARDAQQAEPLLEQPCDHYCLDADGTLRRQWEVARRKGEPWVTAMFHAWEGGAGLYHPGTGALECPCASRAMPPRGRRYITQLRYTLG